MVLPVSEKYSDYAKNICKLLKNSEIRTSFDDRNETLGKRIRETSLLRIPILVVVGEKEVAGNTVSVRLNGTDGGSMTPQELIDKIKADIKAELS